MPPKGKTTPTKGGRKNSKTKKDEKVELMKCSKCGNVQAKQWTGFSLSLRMTCLKCKATPTWTPAPASTTTATSNAPEEPPAARANLEKLFLKYQLAEHDDEVFPPIPADSRPCGLCKRRGIPAGEEADQCGTCRAKIIRNAGMCLLQSDCGWSEESPMIFVLLYKLNPSKADSDKMNRDFIKHAEWMKLEPYLSKGTIDEIKKKTEEWKKEIFPSSWPSASSLGKEAGKVPGPVGGPFREFYTWLWNYLRPSNAGGYGTLVEGETAVDVLSGPLGGNVVWPWMKHFSHFVVGKRLRVSQDTWKTLPMLWIQFGKSFETYDLDSAWGSVFDDFVRHVREKNLTPASPLPAIEPPAKK